MTLQEQSEQDFKAWWEEEGPRLKNLNCINPEEGLPLIVELAWHAAVTRREEERHKYIQRKLLQTRSELAELQRVN